MRTLFLLFFLACATPLWGAGTLPIKITSNTMEYSQNKDQVVFSGDVHVIRQDMQLWSTTLTVTLESKKGQKAQAGALGQKGAISRIVASGNVRIKGAKNRTGTCDRATYDAKADLLTLEGNPVLKDGDNTITGEVIKLYISQNRSEVIGGKKRVEAIFITPDNGAGLTQ